MIVVKNKYLAVLFLIFIFTSCSNDSSVVLTGMSPPDFLEGTWSSRNDEEHIRYTFTTNNILEEDLFHPVVQLISTNFKNEYSLIEYNIEEEYMPFRQNPPQVESYTVRITRKDGGIINPDLGNTMVFRKFDNVKRVINGEIYDTIQLDFGGYNGSFLFKE